MFVNVKLKNNIESLITYVMNNVNIIAYNDFKVEF